MSPALRLFLLCAVAEISAIAADPPLWSGVIEVGAMHAAPGDLQDGDGELAVDESRIEARTYWHPTPGTWLGLGLGGGVNRYADDAGTLDGRITWLRLPVTVMWSEHWGFTSLSSVGSATDGQVAVRDGRCWQVQAGLVFARDADLVVALSAVVNSRIGLPPAIFPLVSLVWRIDDAWKLTVIDEIDNVSRLTRRIDPAWAASLLLDLRLFEFALAHDTGGAAVFADDRAILGIEGDWRPLGEEHAGERWLAVRPFIGVVVRHIAQRTADGDELSSSWVSPAPAAGLSLRADF